MKVSGLSIKQVAKLIERSLDYVKSRWAEIRPLITSDTSTNRLDPPETLSLSSADLRHAATKRRYGLSWRSQSQSQWPDSRSDTLTDALCRESMIREDPKEWRHDPRLTIQTARKLELSLNDFHEALKLRKDGKSWADIANLKHPWFSEESYDRRCPSLHKAAPD